MNSEKQYTPGLINNQSRLYFAILPFPKVLTKFPFAAPFILFQLILGIYYALQYK